MKSHVFLILLCSSGILYGMNSGIGSTYDTPHFATTITQDLLGHYLLTAPPYFPGFFSTFNTVIGCLDEYEHLHWDGLKVDFQAKGVYYDQNRGQNWWSYYFEPIELGNIQGDLIKFPTYKKITFSLTSEFELSRERAHELITKYVHIKPHIQQKIDAFVAHEFANNFVIGVHYRGTDKKSEAPEVPFELVYANLVELLKNHASKSVKIFVATDDAHFLDYIRAKFPELVISWDSLRSTDGQPIHQAGVPITWDTPRPHNGGYEHISNYKKGEDALIDAVLLSKTNFLLKTASNLSDCSLQFNPTLPFLHLNLTDSLTTKHALSPAQALDTYLGLLDLYEQRKQTNIQLNLNKEDVPFDVQVESCCPASYQSNDDQASRAQNHALSNYYLNIVRLNTLEMPQDRVNELMKYIKVKQHVIERVNTIAAQIDRKNFVIGLHYKKPSPFFAQLQPTVPHEPIMQKLHEVCPANNYTIILSTNDDDFKDLVTRTHSDHVTVLSDAEDHASWAIKNETDLVNVLVLAKSNILLATSSETSRMVKRFNANLPQVLFDTYWLTATL